MEIRENNGLMKISKEEAQKIGGLHFDEMLGNYEQTIFCLDDSGSMRAGVSSSSWDEAGNKAESRLEILKKSFTRYLDHKFKKNPLSRVSVVTFGHAAHTLVEDTDDVRLVKAAVDTMQGFGNHTYLHYGLFKAMAIVKRTCRAWVPRIIIITDGECHNRDQVSKVFEKFIGMRVIVDVIFIKGDSSYWESAVEFLTNLCKRTGGVFESVVSADEFAEKFLNVATRLALPPAAE